MAYSTLILWVFPLDQIADVGASPIQNRKLISSEMIFEVFQLVRSQYFYVADRRTDGGTDNLPLHNRALRSIAR